MGYTPSGGTKGLGAFNDTPQTTADMNQLVELIGKTGNYLGSITETARDTIGGAALYEGLLVYNSTASQLEMYDGSGWVLPGDTGWVPFTAFGPGWTAPPSADLIPEIRRINGVTAIRGFLVAGSGVTFTDLATAPAGFGPVKPTWYTYTRASSNSSFQGMLSISTTGVISLPDGYRSGSFAVGQYLPITGSYMR